MQIVSYYYFFFTDCHWYFVIWPILMCMELAQVKQVNELYFSILERNSSQASRLKDTIPISQKSTIAHIQAACVAKMNWIFFSFFFFLNFKTLIWLIHTNTKLYRIGQCQLNRPCVQISNVFRGHERGNFKVDHALYYCFIPALWLYPKNDLLPFLSTSKSNSSPC